MSQTIEQMRGDIINKLQSGDLNGGLEALEAALDHDPTDVQTVLLAREVEKQLGGSYRDQREGVYLHNLRKAWPTPLRGHELLKAASFQNAPRLMEEIATLALTPSGDPVAEQGELVSIIVPVYNRANGFTPSLDSLLAQDYSNIEIILVDDGSTDSTLNALNEFKESHPETTTHVLSTKENRGQGAARNLGAEAASGQYILFHDSDDLLAVHAVKKMVAALHKSPTSGWAAPLTVQRGEVNRLFGFEKAELRITVSRSQFTICGLMRRAMFTALGGFNDSMRNGLEDWEFFIRALSHGYRPLQLPEVGLIYNRQADSTTGRLHRQQERRRRAKLDIIEAHPNLYRTPQPEELPLLESSDHFAEQFIKREGVGAASGMPNPLVAAPAEPPASEEVDQAFSTETPRTDRPLRALFVCHDYPPLRIAGAQLYAHYLAKALKKIGHEVDVFYARNLSSVEQGAKAGDLLEDQYEGVRVYQLIVDNTSQAFDRNPQYAFENTQAEKHFESLLEKNGYDLVHVHLLYRMSTKLPVIARRRKIPIVATLHDYWLPCAMGHMVDSQGRECSGPETPAKCASCITGFRAPQPPTDIVSFFEARQNATKLAFSQFDRVFSPSAFLADVHERHGFGRPEVLPLGWLPLEGVTQKPAGERLIFGFCGQIVFRKGVDVMLRSFADLKPGNWELHLHGKIQDEQYFEQLRPMIENHPSISYHGPYHSDELPAIYSTLDVSIMPSRRENYPLTLLESLSAGVPPIAADVGGVREILGESGKSGFVFPNGDSDALLAILTQLVKEPERVSSMRKTLPQPKSIDENALEVEAVYRGLLKPTATEPATNSKLKYRVEGSLLAGGAVIADHSTEARGRETSWRN